MNSLHRKYSLDRVGEEELTGEEGLGAFRAGLPFTGLLEGRFASGKVQFEVEYEEGEPTGVRREWFENGLLKFQVYRTAFREVHEWYHENGVMKEEKQYLLRLPDYLVHHRKITEDELLTYNYSGGNTHFNHGLNGTISEFHANREPKSMLCFELGIQTEYREWDEAGNEIAKERLLEDSADFEELMRRRKQERAAKKKKIKPQP